MWISLLTLCLLAASGAAGAQTLQDIERLDAAVVEACGGAASYIGLIGYNTYRVG